MPLVLAFTLTWSGLWNCVKSFLLAFTVLTYRRFGAVQNQGHCVSSLHKSCPLFMFFPAALSWWWWQRSGWLVCLRTAREMKSHCVSVWLRKAYGDPGLLLVSSLRLVLQLKCGFFSAGDNLCLVLGVLVLTIVLSRQGAEQLAGREDWGLGKLRKQVA